MTRDEAIQVLSEYDVNFGYRTEFEIRDAIDTAIEALKQGDILQEIRREIEKPLRDELCFDTAAAKAQYIALSWVRGIIDKHIGDMK